MKLFSKAAIIILMIAMTFTVASCSNASNEASSSGSKGTTQPAIDKETPLTLEFIDDGEITITDPWSTLKYSKNGGLPTALEGSSISVKKDDKIAFYAVESETTHGKPMKINCSSDCYIYGNIMSLVTLDNSGSWNPFAVTLTQDYAFTNLFYAEMDPCTGWYSDSLQNHPSKKLYLPATTLTQACYRGMFRNNSGITKTPDLPAPVLVQECYSYMFYDCNNIREIKCLATDISAQYCTEEWVLHVYSGAGTFTKKAGTNWNEGIQGIPLGWDRDNQEYIHWTVIEE